MSPDAQRIAIAEWCGWTWDINDSKQVYWMHKNKPFLSFKEPPDYLNDLNAIHEAEEKLSPSQKDLFANSIIHPTHGPHWRFNCLHATAAQRAEALLKTIGKWTEELEPKEKAE